jgi:hypothetical protein
MDSIAERASADARRGREDDKREVEFYVRAKTGPGKRDWTTIGVALSRWEKNRQTKLNKYHPQTTKRTRSVRRASTRRASGRVNSAVFKNRTDHFWSSPIATPRSSSSVCRKSANMTSA